ncbi:hypothetical protein EBT25_15000 [bacterium]|nr:hypothetical protein [bacterium]
MGNHVGRIHPKDDHMLCDHVKKLIHAYSPIENNCKMHCRASIHTRLRRGSFFGDGSENEEAMSPAFKSKELIWALSHYPHGTKERDSEH